MTRTLLLLALLITLGIGSLGTAAFLLLKEEGEPIEPAAAAAAVEETAPVMQPEPTSQPTIVAKATAIASPTATELTITIHDGENNHTIISSARTVGDLLAEAGIILGESDAANPPAETPLVDGLVVQITRAIPLTIQVDGQAYAIFSSARTPAEVLANTGIALGELDTVNPAADVVLNAGDTVRVVRVREESIFFDVEVPYQTVYQPSDDLDLDTKAVISRGVPGIKRQSTRIRYEDGVEVSRVDEGEWIEQEPVNEVIGYGTRITTHVVDTPEGPREYWRVVHMRVTAYTAASSGKSPDHPSYGITASGRPAGTGIVAVDPNVIPFRSEVYVPGYGIGYAGDTGGGIKGRWIDLGYDEDELQTWNGYVDVYYLTPVPAEVNYLIPEVLP
ncbi:MAG: ubiquitin-like domain-containing protein [Candidatus Promineifilaceae bacterium]